MRFHALYARKGYLHEFVVLLVTEIFPQVIDRAVRMNGMRRYACRGQADVQRINSSLAFGKLLCTGGSRASAHGQHWCALSLGAVHSVTRHRRVLPSLEGALFIYVRFLNKMNRNILPAAGRIFLITGQNGSGKTRWLQQFSTSVLSGGAKNYGRLICLSGTVMDKFPLDGDPEKYAYFGRRTNNNMFSEIAPYRRLLAYMGASKNNHANMVERINLAHSLLKSINLGPSLRLKFRRGRNSKAKVDDGEIKDNLDLIISLEDLKKDRKLSTRVAQVNEGLIHIAGIGFHKNGQEYELMDLSSGERTYALTVLALAFTVNDRSVVVFDEPENSLHPQWQTKIMRDMWHLIANLSRDSRLIAATHSPLVVSSAFDRETYVLDMQGQGAWTHSSQYGSSVDVVLKKQFGLESPRAMSFLVAIRNCIEALVTAEIEPEAFKAAASLLFDMPIDLRKH